jgi:hypothetical protein
MILYSLNTIDAYNSHITAYSAPIPNSQTLVNNLQVNTINEITTVTFDTSSYIIYPATQTTLNLQNCFLVAVATGPIYQNTLRQHFKPPTFSRDCYRVASAPSTTVSSTSTSTSTSTTTSTTTITTTSSTTTIIPTTTTITTTTTATTIIIKTSTNIQTTTVALSQSIKCPNVDDLCTLSWTYRNIDDTISMKLVVQNKGRNIWYAIGFNERPTMVSFFFCLVFFQE